MAKTTKRKYTTVVSPRGVMKWGWLTKPNTKFDADGTYSVDLQVDPTSKEVAAFLANLTAEANKAFAEEVKNDPKKKGWAKYVPFSEETDDNGDPTGLTIIKAKTKAVFKIDDEVRSVRIDLFDAAGGKIPASVRLGRGSEIKFSAVLLPMVNASTKQIGIRLALKAVQVLTLVEFESGTATSYGFGSEDGFTVNADEPSEEAQFAEAGEDAGEESADF